MQARTTGSTSHTIIGEQADGQLVFRDSTGAEYVTGDNLEEYGTEGLTQEEWQAITASRWAHAKASAR